MTWRYEQVTGRLLYNGDLVAIGYSGAGEGKNNPAMEDVHNVGPTPKGKYEIGPPVDTTTHGPYVLRLTACAGNDMCGRSGFLIHGDSVSKPGTASQGCIIMPRAVREKIWNSGDHSLEVI